MKSIVAIVFVAFSAIVLKGQHIDMTAPVYQHAQKIVDNKIQPVSDDLTLSCLGNLLSNDKDTRAFYFKVYRTIAKKAKGQLAEDITGYANTYFELYPADAIDNFKKLDKEEQELFLDNITFEFYASGDDYLADIDNYFNTIVNNCAACSIDNPTIVYIKKQMIGRAKEMTLEDQALISR